MNLNLQTTMPEDLNPEVKEHAPSGRVHPLVQCSCGSRTFERVTPVHGVWREYVVFNEDGTEDFENSESTTDDLRHGKPPKTMKCGECGKKHRNPDTLNDKRSNREP